MGSQSQTPQTKQQAQTYYWVRVWRCFNKPFRWFWWMFNGPRNPERWDEIRSWLLYLPSVPVWLNNPLGESIFIKCKQQLNESRLWRFSENCDGSCNAHCYYCYYPSLHQHGPLRLLLREALGCLPLCYLKTAGPPPAPFEHADQGHLWNNEWMYLEWGSSFTLFAFLRLSCIFICPSSFLLIETP